MKDLGLIPIQKSVFFGDLTAPEFSAVKKLAYELLNTDTDKCLWLKCSLDESRIRLCLGYKNFEYTEPDGYAAI